MKRLALAITMVCVPAGLLAQGGVRAPTDSVSAPVRDVRYELTFTRANAQQRAVDEGDGVGWGHEWGGGADRGRFEAERAELVVGRPDPG